MHLFPLLPLLLPPFLRECARLFPSSLLPPCSQLLSARSLASAPFADLIRNVCCAMMQHAAIGNSDLSSPPPHGRREEQ